LIKIKEVCKEFNMAYHLDGARLFNAMVEKNETPKAYGELFDTISICLSKGLGAPVGSVLLGSKAQIKKALRIRKLFGGAMRQSGYLAAAGIYALDHHVNRLKEDHLRAKKIGQILSGLTYVTNIEEIETNILIFNLDKSVEEKEFIEFLNRHHIYLISMGEGKLRMVTHLDFTDEMLDKLEQVLKKFNK